MKIYEENINYNALRLIKEEIGCPYEYCDEDNNQDHMRLISLGFVQGVIAMADAMKEVLKA